MRLLLLLIWFLFMASASFWLPAHEGDIGGEGPTFVPVHAVVAGLAAIGVRERVQSAREALVSALPAVVMLGAAAAAGYVLNEQAEGERGGPIYLYFGVALWASWATLVLSSALVARTKWNGLAGIGVGALVAMVGLFFFTARID